MLFNPTTTKFSFSQKYITSLFQNMQSFKQEESSPMDVNLVPHIVVPLPPTNFGDSNDPKHYIITYSMQVDWAIKTSGATDFPSSLTMPVWLH